MTAIEYTGRRRQAAALIGGTAWLAVLLSLGNSLATNASSITDVLWVLVGFSTFLTIWTNTAIAIVCTLPLIRPRSRAGRFCRRPGVVTALATAITIVAVAYELLLRQSWGPVGIGLLTNLLLHYLIPICYVIFWAAVTPKASIEWRGPLYWSSYMIAYSLYVILLGELTGLYPYPFVDVTEVGYSTAILNAVGFWLLFILVALGYVALGRVHSRWQERSAP